jgi:hypothetical protein
MLAGVIPLNTLCPKQLSLVTGVLNGNSADPPVDISRQNVAYGNNLGRLHNVNRNTPFLAQIRQLFVTGSGDVKSFDSPC